MIDTAKLNAELSRRHWSKATLSRLSGVSYSTILYLLSDKGNGALFDTVIRVCNTLDLPVESVYKEV